MDKLEPSSNPLAYIGSVIELADAEPIDQLACIDRDMALAAPDEKLKTFVDLSDTYGKLVRKGYFNGDVLALEQKLWAVAEEYAQLRYDLDVEDAIGKAIAPRTAAAIELDRQAELRRRQEVSEMMPTVRAVWITAMQRPRARPRTPAATKTRCSGPC